MKFHIEFAYASKTREKLINLIHGGGLAADGPLKIVGAWIAVQTGVGYAVVETKDAKLLYEMCSNWSDYGEVKVTPVLPAVEI